MRRAPLERRAPIDWALRMIGAALYRRAGERGRLRYLADHEPPLKPATFAAACVQRHVLAASELEPRVGDQEVDLIRALEPDDYLPELDAALAKLDYLPAGILNTEALLLWALIRRARPSVYLESGTGRGYSAALAAQALRRNGDGAALRTFGEGEPEVVESARRTLEPYDDCIFIEGRSEEALPGAVQGLEGRVGVFIDGPKGSSPAFIELLERLFEAAEPTFVAVHDCEAHLPRGFDRTGKWPQGRINPTRAQLEDFYLATQLEDRFVLAYMDDRWCRRYERLNEPIYRTDPTFGPFRFKGSRQVSHSPVIGVLVGREFLAGLHSGLASAPLSYASPS